MLPFNGIPLPPKMMNITEVVPVLTWMDTQIMQSLDDIRVVKISFLGRKRDYIHTQK